uniref:(northern house mosquito) hypothetical protein n=1 Tax=Culex pipiens TaxID=7175 RepID=A0A8D8IFX6_CULPI
MLDSEDIWRRISLTIVFSSDQLFLRPPAGDISVIVRCCPLEPWAALSSLLLSSLSRSEMPRPLPEVPAVDPLPLVPAPPPPLPLPILLPSILFRILAQILLASSKLANSANKTGSS